MYRTANVNALIQEALRKQLDNAKYADLDARDSVDLASEYASFIRQQTKVDNLKNSGRYGTPAMRQKADQTNEEIISQSVASIMKGIISGEISKSRTATKALNDFLGSINISTEMSEFLGRQLQSVERLARKGYDGMQQIPATDMALLKELQSSLMKTAGISEYVPAFQNERATPRSPMEAVSWDTRGTPGKQSSTKKSSGKRRGRPPGRKNNRTLMDQLDKEALASGNKGILDVSPAIKKAMAIERRNSPSLIDPVVSQYMDPNTTQLAIQSSSPWDAVQTGSHWGSVLGDQGELPGINLSAFKERRPAIEDDDDDDGTIFAQPSPASTGGPFGLPRGTQLGRQHIATLTREVKEAGESMRGFDRITGKNDRLNVLRVWKALQSIPDLSDEEKSFSAAMARIDPRTATPLLKRRGRGRKLPTSVAQRVLQTALNVAKKVKGSTKKIQNQIAKEVLKRWSTMT